MPEVFTDLFISLDGSTLGTRSPGYFGYDGPDLRDWITREQHRPHRDVMGRKTFQALAELPAEHRDASWEVMTRQPTTVFSRTLTSADWPGVQLSSDDAVEEVRRLKHAGDADLRTIGSLSLVQQLLDAGVVDHLRLVVFPLVLGETGRRPVFDGLGDIGLQLADQAVLDGRILLLDYRPAGRPPYVG